MGTHPDQVINIPQSIKMERLWLLGHFATRVGGVVSLCPMLGIPILGVMMTNLKKVLLATASLGVMSSPAFALDYQQYINSITTASTLVNPTGGQNFIGAYAFGASPALASGTQFVTLTANQLDITKILGDNTIRQGVGVVDLEFGNAINAFSPRGANNIGTSTQFTSVDLNSVNVGIVGSTFGLGLGVPPVLDLRQSNLLPNGDIGSVSAQQVNILAAGYDLTSGGLPVTSGSAKIGTDVQFDAANKPKVDEKGNVLGQSTQANVFSQNTATVNLTNGNIILPAVADVLVYQKAGETDVAQVNVAAAGSAPALTPPPGPGPRPGLIDPEVVNLVQFNSVTQNSLTVNTPYSNLFDQSTGAIQLLGGDQRYESGIGPFGPIYSGDNFFNQAAGLQKTPGFPGFETYQEGFTIGNAITALTWSPAANFGGGVGGDTWGPGRFAGQGAVSVRDVTQAGVLSLNSVSGNANVIFGGNRNTNAIEYNPANNFPPGSFGFPNFNFTDSPFTQAVNYGASGVQVGGAWGDIQNNSFNVLFPGGAFDPLGDTGGVDWGNSVNVIFAGTGVGTSEILRATQFASLSMNTVNLDNTTFQLDANGKPQLDANGAKIVDTENNTGIRGNLGQFAVANFADAPLSLTNVAASVVTGAAQPKVPQSATIADLTQAATLDLNTISAGKVNGDLNVTQNYTQFAAFDDNTLDQSLGGSPVLANSAWALANGGDAKISNLTQFASFTANSFAVNDVSELADVNLQQNFNVNRTNFGPGTANNTLPPVIFQGNQAIVDGGKSASITGNGVDKGVQFANLSINSIQVGGTLNSGAIISQLATNLNVQQTNLAVANSGLGGATATGLTQAATTTINSILSK